MKICRFLFAATLGCFVACSMSSAGIAQITPFDLAGNGGAGLLPGNEVGTGANAGNSTAFGGETGGGFVYDASTNTLDFSFSFQGMTSGLRDAAGGVHLHLPGTPGDPFNENGGIEFFLNNGADPNVTLSTPLIAIGATQGALAGSVSFANKLDKINDLLAGEIYLNIHSEMFPGGELRGTLVPIPEPTNVVLLLTAGVVGLARRR